MMMMMTRAVREGWAFKTAQVFKNTPTHKTHTAHNALHLSKPSGMRPRAPQPSRLISRSSGLRPKKAGSVPTRPRLAERSSVNTGSANSHGGSVVDASKLSCSETR